MSNKNSIYVDNKAKTDLIEVSFIVTDTNLRYGSETLPYASDFILIGLYNGTKSYIRYVSDVVQKTVELSGRIKNIFYNGSCWMALFTDRLYVSYNAIDWKEISRQVDNLIWCGNDWFCSVDNNLYSITPDNEFVLRNTFTGNISFICWTGYYLFVITVQDSTYSLHSSTDQKIFVFKDLDFTSLKNVFYYNNYLVMIGLSGSTQIQITVSGSEIIGIGNLSLVAEDSISFTPSTNFANLSYQNITISSSDLKTWNQQFGNTPGDIVYNFSWQGKFYTLGDFGDYVGALANSNAWTYPEYFRKDDTGNSVCMCSKNVLPFKNIYDFGTTVCTTVSTFSEVLNPIAKVLLSANNNICVFTTEYGIDLPDPKTMIGKILVLANHSSANIFILSNVPLDYNNLPSSIIPNNSSLIICAHNNWLIIKRAI